jgi:hypothetical protein
MSQAVTPNGHAPIQAAAPPTGGETRTVTLAGGGTLTLTASVGFMKLPKAERDFVFSLVDQLDAYEASNPVDDDPDEDDQ